MDAATPLRRSAATLTLAVTAGIAPAAASADSPPGSWTNERILVCDGVEVRTFLTPAGFGTPFHVAGSPDVIIPKHVEVVFEAGADPVVTLDVPGFDVTGPNATRCGYVDPAGLVVDFVGLRT
ncbi:hypothetical protein Q9R29_08700 [Rothia sp. ARF10]|nr:hypothetical protein [Rothia sp. ARF10]